MALNICYQKNPQSLVGKYVYLSKDAITHYPEDLYPHNYLYKIVGVVWSHTFNACVYITKGDSDTYFSSIIIGGYCGHLATGHWKIATRDTVKVAKARGTFPMLAR